MNFIIAKSLEKKMQNKLDSVISISNDIISSPDASDSTVHPIYRYINAIGSSVLSSLLIKLFTGEEVDDVNTLHDDLYFFNNCIPLDKKVGISLKDNLVIPVAWDKDRFKNTLINIGSDCGVPFEFQCTNHMSTLFLPVGVTILYNGNHSVLCGILKREGIIYPNQVVNLTSEYENIRFDGMYYRDIKSNKIIQKVNKFELGAIFEIGRLLVKNNINYLDSKLVINS